VPAPNQADEGAQLYWLHCQPCHGDVGQGLTDDWRAQYPPEDQYCWNSGCHGPQPYHQDFALPTAVPAIIGEGALTKFPTLDSVYRYVSVAMPYFFPGDLTQEEYLAILAHLARANGLWDGRPLTVDSLSQYAIPGAIAGAPTPTLPAVARVTPALVVAPSAVPTSAALATGQPAHTGGMGAAGRLVLFGGVFVLLALGGTTLTNTTYQAGILKKQQKEKERKEESENKPAVSPLSTVQVIVQEDISTPSKTDTSQFD